MKSSSLASSRKAWRLIQSLLSRVLTNGRESTIGGDDILDMGRIQADTGHPFKVTRAGNTVRMQKGLISSFSNGAQPSTWVMNDFGGFVITSYPAWIVLRITTSANVPYSITNPIETYYVVQTGGQTIAPLAEVSEPLAFLGSFSITGQAVSESSIAIPIAFLTQDTTHQLLKQNVSLQLQANHHNLFYFV
jgi:hypothetical protein